ncbi:DEAD/DEAH box helicase [Paenibacillus sp. FJAT-26967]|uniref:DEAD/DEAH box helicase n=1 Tax=Paenibacillus sp. FJAT-26967 TaxID=1729690 RepID=UPI000838CB4B|nr:DEAD/DEAH box helicase [Paenibacillus sp. FJAT-26967]
MSFPFVNLGVSPELAKLLTRHGINEPTPVQQLALPIVFGGRDVIAQAQTGTGKTLAFLLPMLERTDTSRSEVQGLILTPTRELAIQIAAEAAKLAPYMGVNVLAAYGGQDVEKQLRKLTSNGGAHIIVATPGRLLDHLRRESFNLYKLSMLVLDEADQMLHMGFLNEVEEIIAQTPQHLRQTMLFSATMPDPIRNLAQRYMRNPEEVRVKAPQVTLTEIDQTVVRTTDRGKLDTLCKAIDKSQPYLAMIFCRTKRRAAALNAELQERGYKSDELHGDLSQSKREQVMKRFRDASIQLLVATDVAARGIDVEGVTHVFNYDIPQDAQSYIHRIGRTGRAGQTGVAITFATQRDQVYVDQIEQGIRQQLRRQDATHGEREGAGGDRPERGSRDSRGGQGGAGRPGKTKYTGQGGARRAAARSEGRWEHRSADDKRSGSSSRGGSRGGAARGSDTRSSDARGSRGGGGWSERGGSAGARGADAPRGADRGDSWSSESRDSGRKPAGRSTGGRRGGSGDGAAYGGGRMSDRGAARSTSGRSSNPRGGTSRNEGSRDTDFRTSREGGGRAGTDFRAGRDSNSSDRGERGNVPRGGARDVTSGPFGEAGWGLSAAQREASQRTPKGQGGSGARGSSRGTGGPKGSRGGGSGSRGPSARGGGPRGNSPRGGGFKRGR